MPSRSVRCELCGNLTKEPAVVEMYGFGENPPIIKFQALCPSCCQRHRDFGSIKSETRYQAGE